MSQRHLFLAVLLPCLSLLPLTAQSYCQLYPSFACRKHAMFVPGHNFIGEGVDITTLDRKGAYVVDTSKWERPNGTCTLCRNLLMGGQLQKLPLAGADWQENRVCHRKAATSMEELDTDVANAAATEVTNDWKMELGLATLLAEDFKSDLGLSKAQVAFAGSHSRMAIFAHQKSRQDRHSFLRRELSCEYYRLRLHQSRPLLSFHFVQALDRLPQKYDPEEYQHFINVYGTHYINQVQLGGRARYLLALQTCAMALAGFAASRVKECFDLEASLGFKWFLGSASLTSKCDDLWMGNAKGQFYDMYANQHMEVVGGDRQVEMLFSNVQDLQLLSEWMESAKTNPGLISYSLLSLHTLLNRRDPRRNLLKQAIVGYINGRALRRDCPQSCPRWSSRSSEDSCSCMCEANGVINNQCCAIERGRAHLRFYVESGSKLWGDHFSATDAFIKVFFQNQERRTRIIQGDNNPQWSEMLDFGAVTLEGNNHFRVQIWDSDVWHDDLLHECYGWLKAGFGNVWLRCHLRYGQVKFYYLLECGRTLTGSSCHDYLPLRLPTSYFNNTSLHSGALSLPHRFYDQMLLG